MNTCAKCRQTINVKAGSALVVIDGARPFKLCPNCTTLVINTSEIELDTVEARRAKIKDARDARNAARLAAREAAPAASKPVSKKPAPEIAKLKSK